MRLSELIVCVLAIVGLTVISHAQTRPDRSDPQTLIQLEKDWDAAFLKKDVRFLETVLADEFTAKVYGDTAVVWFRRRLVGPSQGRSIEVVYRYVDVFVWRANRWQCVASQSTRVPNG